jgi:hypothetical protein
MGHEEGSMTPKTKLIIGLIVLWLSLWAFCLWLIWQPYTFSHVPTVKGSWCDGGKCWVVEKGKVSRL